LLFKRGYDPIELERIKNDLKNTIGIAFQKKHGKNHSEVIKENIIRQFFYCAMLAVLLIFSYSKQSIFKIDDLFDSNFTEYAILVCLSFLPMLFIKWSNKKATQKFQKAL
jgi:hypothetical protein